MPEEIKGTNAGSLRDDIRSGKVNHDDVLMLTYGDGDTLEVIYKQGAPYLIGSFEAPFDVRRKHTFARGCALDDYVSWERKGSFDELYRE